MLPSRVHVEGGRTWPETALVGRWLAHDSTRAVPGRFVASPDGVLFEAENGHTYRETDQISEWVFERCAEENLRFVNTEPVRS